MKSIGITEYDIRQNQEVSDSFNKVCDRILKDSLEDPEDLVKYNEVEE